MPSARLPSFWRFQVVGWALFAVASFPLKLAALPVASALALTFTREPLGFALSCGLRLLYRRFAGPRTRVVLIVGAACVLAGAIDTLVGRFVSELTGHPEEPIYTFGVFCFRGTLYVSWSLLYFWIKTAEAERARELHVARADASRREAELRLLRAQVNPHFLFNALNTLLATLPPGEPRPRRVVTGLAAYLRYSLEHHDREFVPAAAEFDAALAYLAVEEERFRGELLVEAHLDDDARDFAVPSVLLQPLVENAVKYARQTGEPPYRLRLEVTRPAPDALVLSVANTGTWVDPASAPAPHGTGLANLSRRLDLLFPDRHRLETASRDGWVTVTLTLHAAASAASAAPAHSTAAEASA